MYTKPEHPKTVAKYNACVDTLVNTSKSRHLLNVSLYSYPRVTEWQSHQAARGTGDPLHS